MPGSLAPQSNFRAIHLKNTGIAAGGATTGSYACSRQETQFHQASGIIPRKIDPVEDGDIPVAEVQETALATQLHL